MSPIYVFLRSARRSGVPLFYKLVGGLHRENFIVSLLMRLSSKNQLKSISTRIDSQDQALKYLWVRYSHQKISTSGVSQKGVHIYLCPVNTEKESAFVYVQYMHEYN